MHSVLERQDKVGNNELDFDDSVCKYTRRLVEDYSKLFCYNARDLSPCGFNVKCKVSYMN